MHMEFTWLMVLRVTIPFFRRAQSVKDLWVAIHINVIFFVNFKSMILSCYSADKRQFDIKIAKLEYSYDNFCKFWMGVKFCHIRFVTYWEPEFQRHSTLPNVPKTYELLLDRNSKTRCAEYTLTDDVNFIKINSRGNAYKGCSCYSGRLVGGSLLNEIRVQEVQECKQFLGFVYGANTTGFAGKKAFSKHSLEVSITQ